MVSDKKSANLFEDSLYVSFLSFAAFEIISLSLAFNSLIMMCLGMDRSFFSEMAQLWYLCSFSYLIQLNCHFKWKNSVGEWEIFC